MACFTFFLFWAANSFLSSASAASTFRLIEPVTQGSIYQRETDGVVGETDEGDDESEDGNSDRTFSCEYRWYNVCLKHEGPYPEPQDGEGPVIQLDTVQSIWMQIGWIFVAAFFITFLVASASYAVDADKQSFNHLQFNRNLWIGQQEFYDILIKPNRTGEILEYILGSLTAFCFLSFATRTHRGVQDDELSFVEALGMDMLDNSTTRVIEEVAAVLMLCCFIGRMYGAGADPEYRGLNCAGARYAVSSVLMWFDLIAMTPTLIDALSIFEKDMFPNLIWLRFPRLLDVLLKANSSSEGIGVLAKLMSDNSTLMMVSIYFLGFFWLFCSAAHYLTEHNNPELLWGTEEGYARYGSIPSALYYSLIDFNGEFPNADDFTAPWGRLNCMLISLLGTYTLSVPAGVLGASFESYVKENQARGDAEEQTRFEGRPRRETQDGHLQETSRKRLAPSTLVLVLASVANFVLDTYICQKPVDDWNHATSFETDSWQHRMLPYSRGGELLLAVPFFAEWVWRLATAQQLRVYFFSLWHLVDLVSWVPGYFLLVSLVTHGGAVEYLDEETNFWARYQLALHGACVMRLLKLDRYMGQMFWQLFRVLSDNKVIFKLTFILALTLWLLGSVLMYMAESRNPDDGTRSHFESIPLSLWMTALDFSGEAPLNDHGAFGKAVHAVIILLGVGIFTVPMGLFGAAFRERLDEMHSKTIESWTSFTINVPDALPASSSFRLSVGSPRNQRRTSLTSANQLEAIGHASFIFEQERAQGIYRDINDVYDPYLMQLIPGTWKYRLHKMLLGTQHPGNGPSASWLERTVVFATLLCCFTSSLETLPFFHDCSEDDKSAFDTGFGFAFQPEYCASAKASLVCISMLCMMVTTLEFFARLACHPIHQKVWLSVPGFADALILLDLICTLVHLVGVDMSYTALKVLKIARLWRLLALERFLPAWSQLKEVVIERGYQIGQVSYVLFTFWIFLSVLNWWFLHREFEVESGDHPFAYWYSNFWYSMLYSLIHMGGDYPMTEYPLGVRMYHLLSLFFAWAFVSMPAAIFSAAFRDALEARRIIEQSRRQKASSTICKTLRRVALRRRFRYVVLQAMAVHRSVSTQLLRSRTTNIGLTNLFEMVEKGPNYRRLLIFSTLSHLVLSMLRTVPQFSSDSLWWDLCLIPCIAFSVFNLVVRGATAFLNPAFKLSLTNYLVAFRTLTTIIAILIYFVDLFRFLVAGKRDLLPLACAVQMFSYSQLGWLVSSNAILSLIWTETRDIFIVTGYIASVFWILTSTLWYLFEEHWHDGELGMTDMFSTMYYTCIFLLGEWCNFDFSPLGAALSMLYSLVGVGIQAMPMATVADSLGSLMESGAYDAVIKRSRSADLDIARSRARSTLSSCRMSTDLELQNFSPNAPVRTDE